MYRTRLACARNINCILSHELISLWQSHKKSFEAGFRMSCSYNNILAWYRHQITRITVLLKRDWNFIETAIPNWVSSWLRTLERSDRAAQRTPPNWKSPRFASLPQYSFHATSVNSKSPPFSSSSTHNHDYHTGAVFFCQYWPGFRRGEFNCTFQPWEDFLRAIAWKTLINASKSEMFLIHSRRAHTTL